MQRFVLTLSCPDRTGIVAAVANFLLERQFNIVDSAQFGDDANKLFFMRVCFAPVADIKVEVIRQLFAPIGAHFAMQWAIHVVAI
jgi:formyltetrahydrofolate deformylase